MTIVKLRPSRIKNSTISLCKLRSYSTNVHQIFTRCRAITTTINACINKAIFLFFSER